MKQSHYGFFSGVGSGELGNNPDLLDGYEYEVVDCESFSQVFRAMDHSEAEHVAILSEEANFSADIFTYVTETFNRKEKVSLALFYRKESA